MNYTIPRELYQELTQNIGKESADKFASTFEKFLNIFANKLTIKTLNIKIIFFIIFLFCYNYIILLK